MSARRESVSQKSLVSEESLLIEELRKTNARLEDCLLAIAHDFIEPLRTISMFTELLNRHEGLDAKGRRLTDHVAQGVKRMRGLLDGLNALATSCVEEGPRPVNLADVVSEAIQNLEHAFATSGAAVTVDSLPWVHGDRARLLQVFQNLIGNAIKYASDSRPEIYVTAIQSGPDWTIQIKDNGLGIAHEYHQQIFGLLTRLHGPAIPGAGIGLAICKRVIEGMGGEIWVESELGSGSTFCFRIASTNENGVPPGIAGHNGHSTPVSKTSDVLRLFTVDSQRERVDTQEASLGQ